MPNPLYVSFYTVGNGYEAEAVQLIETLNQFGLDHCVNPIDGNALNSWQLATQHKPNYILRRMEEFPGRPMVWVDADARIKAPPVMFERLECDVAAVWRDGHEMLAGTLFFGPTREAERALGMWDKENRENPEGLNGDQLNFQHVVERMEKAGELNVFRLPQSYALIFDIMKHVGNPVILHTQASRRLRK